MSKMKMFIALALTLGLVGAGSGTLAYRLTAGQPAPRPSAAAALPPAADPPRKADAALHDGRTLLMLVARTGNVDALMLLLAKGADVNAAETRTGTTALIWAALENRADAVRALTKAGADVNDKLVSPPGVRAGGINKAGRQGSSALHLAVQNAHYELASFLLDAGANPNADGPGYTALHIVPSDDETRSHSESLP